MPFKKNIYLIKVFSFLIDLEKKIAARRQAFMEATPIMRKNFSGMMGYACI